MKFSSVFPHFIGHTLLIICFIFQALNGSDVVEEITRSSPSEEKVGESDANNVIVTKGEVVELNCRLFNPDGLQVYWHHDSPLGTKFTISSSSSSSLGENVTERVRVLQDFTLQIYPVAEEDSGYYACTIPNRWHLRILHYVHVIGPPSIVIEPESGSITAVEGDAVQVGCRPKGNPNPRVTWRKQYASQFPDPSSKVLINRRALTFQNVVPADSGTYVCKAENGIGPSAYGRIHIHVLYHPDVKIPNGVIFGGPGYSATLKCLVQAEPPPEVQWIFEQKVVQPSPRLFPVTSGSEHALHFPNVRETDFGFYTCLANNSVGLGLGFVELSGVSSPPVVTRWETSSCDKNNDRKIRSRVKKNRNRTKGSQGCKRRRKRPRTRTQRNVLTCTVQLRLDWAVESYNPVIDYRLMFRRVKRNPSNSHSDVTDWPTNEDEVVGQGWTELSIPADPRIGPVHTKGYTLHGLPGGHHYEAALSARNKFGVSQLSTIFYFSTFPRTSHKEVDIDELFPDALRRSIQDGGLEDKSDGTEEIYGQVGHSKASSSSTTTVTGLRFKNYLTTTTLQFTPTLPPVILILFYTLVF